MADMTEGTLRAVGHSGERITEGLAEGAKDTVQHARSILSQVSLHSVSNSVAEHGVLAGTALGTTRVASDLTLGTTQIASDLALGTSKALVSGIINGAFGTGEAVHSAAMNTTLGRAVNRHGSAAVDSIMGRALKLDSIGSNTKKLL